MKKLSLLSSIFVITLFLASCGGSEDKKDGGSEDKKGVVDPVTVTDADGDGVVDDDDDCDSSREGFKSNDNTDYDGDGCEDDSTEDTDDDNDEVDDGDDECQTSINSNFVSVSTSPGTINDYDGDGCEDDSTEDTDDDNDEVDDDDDECQTSINSNFVSSATNDRDNDGCEDAGEDKDDDDDGLIELTATTLTNIRYQLDGTTYKINASDTGSTMGCSTVDPIGCNGYEITNDIDLVGNFEPVAGNFTAIFDGNNNTINDLTIDNSTQYTGFFTTVASAGEVRSINFVGGSITSSFGNYGYVGVLAGKNEGTVSDISANLSVSSVGAGPNNNTGGLIGENSGILQDSQSSGNISGGTGDSDNVGGLVGSNNGGTIQNSRATGNASGGTGNGDSVGGLVGANKSSSSIRNSYAIGSAKGNAGNGDSVGGLVGTNTGGSIQNSYAIGSANGGDGDDYVGGLVGLIIQGTILNSYALGDVDGGNGATSDSVGRLIGGEQLSTISGNYFDENSGLIGKEEKTFVASKALGKTSDQLKAINNVAPTTDTTCTSAGGTWDGTACTDGHLNLSTNNWDFTADKYPSLKSYKVNASDVQVEGVLLCNQSTDFVQCPMPEADADGDGVTDDIDVDDDNDGLIELTTTTLTNIRYQLDGTTYKINASDTGSTMGCSTVDPIGCNGYEITNDIDLVGNFEPVAGDFTAIFDGNNNTITNLTISNSSSPTGFFAVLGTNSTVKNLSFTSGSIAGSGGDDYVGVLAGTNDGTIFNVSADISVSAGDGSDTVGGLVGKNSSIGTIVNSSATGTADGDAGHDRIGGLVGVNEGTIQNSSATGTANGGGDSDYGIGSLVGNNEGTIQNSYATGTANGGDGADGGIGGLVGDNSSTGTIRNSYATGIANGNDSDDAGTGGLVGVNEGTIQNSYATGNANGGAGTDYVGGLVGGNVSNGTIRNSYSLGAVDGGGNASSGGVGRLVGYKDIGVIITGNYYNDTSSVSNGAELTLGNTEAKGKTLAQLKDLDADDTETDFGASNRWNEFNWNFTDTKYPSLKSYKVDANDAQIAGDLLCGQLPVADFVQCTSP